MTHQHHHKSDNQYSTNQFMIPQDLFEKAVGEEQSNSIQRCCLRLKMTTDIVNDVLAGYGRDNNDISHGHKYGASPFIFRDTEKQQWCGAVRAEIGKFQGSMYEQRITTLKSAHDKVQ